MTQSRTGTLVNIIVTALAQRLQSMVDEGIAKTMLLTGLAPNVEVSYVIIARVGDESRALVGGHDSFSNEELADALRQSANGLETHGRFRAPPGADIFEAAEAFSGGGVAIR